MAINEDILLEKVEKKIKELEDMLDSNDNLRTDWFLGKKYGMMTIRDIIKEEIDYGKH